MDRTPLAREHREPFAVDAHQHLVDGVVDLLPDVATHRDAHHDHLAVRPGRQHLPEPSIGPGASHDVLVE